MAAALIHLFPLQDICSINKYKKRLLRKEQTFFVLIEMREGETQMNIAALSSAALTVSGDGAPVIVRLLTHVIREMAS